MKPDLFPPVAETFRTVVLFGPPGAGKGTLGKILAQAGDHCHISTGEIFRGLSPDTPAGQLCHQYTDQGKLVPDEVSIEVFRHYLQGLVSTNRYLPQQQLLFLDGMPRTPNQARILDGTLRVEKVLLLDADVSVFVKRLQQRSLLEGRTDDADPAVITKRMQIYQTQTYAVIEHYPASLVAKINANQSRLAVLRDVLIALGDLAHG